MHLLIIGKNGQVGYELVEACKIKKLQFDALGRDNLDLTELNEVKAYFKKNHNYDFVINAAAYTNVDQAEDEPKKADLINHQAVRVIAEMCEKYNMPLLHISTDYVFDGGSLTLYEESDKPNPKSLYGLSKLAGEKAVTKILKKHIILRVSWVFGRHGYNFVKTIARLIRTKDALSVVSDQYGCPTAARDIARVILEIVTFKKAHQWGIYHYAGFPLTTWHQLAIGVLPYVKDRKVSVIRAIETKDYPVKAHRPHNSGLSVGKIIQAYDVQQHAWSDYLQETIEALDKK